MEWLHKLAHFARVSHLDLWLGGDFAAEALAQSGETAEHEALSLFIFRLYSSAFHIFARRNSFHVVNESFHGFVVRRFIGGCEVTCEFSFLDWEEEGRLVTYLPEHTIYWPCKDPHAMPAVELGGAHILCCDWEMLYAANEVRALLRPGQPASPYEDLILRHVRPARRREIDRQLVVAYGAE